MISTEMKGGATFLGFTLEELVTHILYLEVFRNSLEPEVQEYGQRVLMKSRMERLDERAAS